MILRVALLLAVGSLLSSAAAAAKTYPGVLPDPIFSTPNGAVYCYVDVPGFEDFRPELFCWTPNDGRAVWITATGLRPSTHYFTQRPEIVHDIGILKGYKPRALLLPFGEYWDYRCTNLTKIETCYSGRLGKLGFRCRGARTGLTCQNARDHGFWIGRFRGFQLF
jgi:hypothetical protein